MIESMLHLLFTDVMGRHHEVIVVLNGLPDSLEGVRAGVDGSSIPGYGVVEKSDVFLKPASSRVVDLSRFGIGYLAVGRVLLNNDREHPWDPRFIMERVLDSVGSAGYSVRTGCELEFYIAKVAKAYLGKRRQYLAVREIPGSSAGYGMGSHYTITTNGELEELLGELMSVLGKSGVTIGKVHGENGYFSQYEASLAPGDPLSMADNILLAVASIRKTLGSRGLHALFMPKPFPGDYGNGLHLHFSMWVGERNIFFDGDELSDAGRYFIGGILEHAESLTAFTNPSVNSFRRLIEGFEAPVYVSWGFANRSTMIRVPSGGGRIEVRTPDASMNPYLGVSAVILAGLDGLRKRIDPGDPVNYNLYEEHDNSLRKLPRSLEEAIDALVSDNDYLKPVFPSDLIDYYVEVKLSEARRARSIPSVVDYISLPHLA